MFMWYPVKDGYPSVADARYWLWICNYVTRVAKTYILC